MFGVIYFSLGILKKFFNAENMQKMQMTIIISGCLGGFLTIISWDMTASFFSCFQYFTYSLYLTDNKTEAQFYRN